MQVHYLSGPINVKDAEGKLAQPGDLLAVELCNLGSLPGQRLSLFVTVNLTHMPDIGSQMISQTDS